MTLAARYPLGRAYLLGVGSLLLGQGAAGLIVRVSGHDPHAATRLLSDPMHSTIHVAWGAVMLLAVARRDPRVERAVLLAFGLFYVGFLALGLLVHHPLGMQIDGKENAFHAVIGPLALIIWALERRRGPSRLPSSDLEDAL